MKRIKINIAFLIGIFVLSLSIGLVFAAFVFNQVVTVDANLGGVTIESKNYLIYAKDNNLATDNVNYDKAEALRKDTVAVIEGIKINYSATYPKTKDTVFSDSKSYYVKDGEKYVPVSPYAGNNTVKYKEEDISISDCYEQVRSYSDIDRITTAYDSSFNELTPTILIADKTQFTITVSGLLITVDTVISETLGIITSATVSATDKNYKAVIGVDGISMVIIDTDVTHAEGGYRAVKANSKITCSATKNKYHADGDTTNKYYLSQLGLQFTFKSEIAVYVRIHIQDAWTRTRAYSSNTKELYVMKDLAGGKSPFSVSSDNADEWVFVEETNYVYLKKMYVPEKNETTGEFESTTYTFDVNEAYYYNATRSSAFIDYIDVDVSFTVDIVQANRAKAKWGIDPSVDFKD